MPVELDIRKWCTIIKLEGYTTPSSARTLVENFHQIVGSLEEEGVEIDMFMLLDDTNGSQSVAKPTLRKRDRRTDQGLTEPREFKVDTN